jgi:hypothetical protein
MGLCKDGLHASLARRVLWRGASIAKPAMRRDCLWIKKQQISLGKVAKAIFDFRFSSIEEKRNEEKNVLRYRLERNCGNAAVILGKWFHSSGESGCQEVESEQR